MVDANLLLDYLAWRFSAQAIRPFPEPNLQHLSDPNLKEAFSWYLELAKPILTSPHVIAEIQGLAKSRLDWHGKRLEYFWRFAQQELTRLRLQEQLVRTWRWMVTIFRRLDQPTRRSWHWLRIPTDSC